MCVLQKPKALRRIGGPAGGRGSQAQARWEAGGAEGPSADSPRAVGAGRGWDPTAASLGRKVLGHQPWLGTFQTPGRGRPASPVAGNGARTQLTASETRGPSHQPPSGHKVVGISLPAPLRSCRAGRTLELGDPGCMALAGQPRPRVQAAARCTGSKPGPPDSHTVLKVLLIAISLQNFYLK